MIFISDKYSKHRMSEGSNERERLEYTIHRPQSDYTGIISNVCGCNECFCNNSIIFKYNLLRIIPSSCRKISSIMQLF